MRSSCDCWYMLACLAFTLHRFYLGIERYFFILTFPGSWWCFITLWPVLFYHFWKFSIILYFSTLLHLPLFSLVVGACFFILSDKSFMFYLCLLSCCSLVLHPRYLVTSGASHTLGKHLAPCSLSSTSNCYICQF